MASEKHDLDLDDLSVELEDEVDDDDDDDDNDDNMNVNNSSGNSNNDNKNKNNHKWEQHKEFEDSLTECLTISKSKISIVTQLSIKYLNRYKDIVHYIEKFIRKGKTINNTKLPQLFIIDSICRAELKENSSKFIKRFGRNIDKTFHALCRGPQSDKASIKRVFTLWNKEQWFPNDKMKQIVAIIKTFKDDHHHHHHKKHHKKHHHKSKKKHKKKEKEKEKGNGNGNGNGHGLLKSLQSLTNNDDEDDGNDVHIAYDDDDDDDEDNDDMQIKLERLKAAKRKPKEITNVGLKRKLTESRSPLQLLPSKKIKIDHDHIQMNQQNQAHIHTQPQPQTQTQTQPLQPQQKQTQIQQSIQQQIQHIHPQHIGAMMNPHSHYVYGTLQPQLQPQPQPPPQPQQPQPQHYLYHHPQQQSQHHLPPHHLHPPQHPNVSSSQYGIGWELSPDQSRVSPDRYRVLSCTIYVGFWNDVHVDIDKLRQEGNEFGEVLKIMPHPTKPPHKHAFIQFGSRIIAENAKSGLRKRFNHLEFVQKVGWGRPPKLVKESFKFDTGIGEILRSEAPHIQLKQQTLTAANQPPNTNFVNIERQNLINGAANASYDSYPQTMQYAPYNHNHNQSYDSYTPQQVPPVVHHPYY